jgi:hypothetical protein
MCGGTSIHGRLVDRLDDVIVEIMDAMKEDVKKSVLAEKQGRALGIAQCIAFIRKPFVVNVDEVRQEAMDRYYASHPDEADE